MITPTSAPWSQHEDGPHLGPHQRLARLLRARRRVERMRLGHHRVADALLAVARRSRIDPPRLERRRDLADPGDERGVAQRQAVGLGQPQTRSNASPSFSASRRRISSRSQKRRPRSCTHSKYETVTPPAFVSTSGRTGIPRSARIASAATDVGPFAPSTTSRQRRFAGVRRRHLVLAGREHEDVAVELEQLGVREPCRLEALERAVLADVLVERRDVEPRRIVDAARDVRDADHGRALLGSSVAAMPPTLPKPCTAQRRPARFQPSRAQARSITITTPGAGRLVPEDRAADRDRLAGHDLRARRSPSAPSRCPSSTPSSARSWPCRARECPPAGR